MYFDIDPSFLCDISIRESGNYYLNKPNPTEEDLIEVLKGKGYWSSQRNDDHPEFKKLREELGKQGFIKIERGWWNGDIVLKEFFLNGARFRKNEQFPCGAAISHTVRSKLARKNKNY